MKLIVAAVFALLAVSAYAESSSDWNQIDWSKVVPVTELPGFWDGRDLGPAFYKGPERTRAGRIVGGQVVNPHSHPYQAGLLVQMGGGTALCGASVIGSRTILTAGHCSLGTSSTLVILGAHELTANEPTQHRQTVESWAYRIHPDYNPNNLHNDISILIMPWDAPINAHIQVSELAPGDAWDFNGEWATMTGWGGIESGGTSSHLRSVENHVISNGECQSVFGGTVVWSTICTSTAGGRGTCGGDSGNNDKAQLISIKTIFVNLFLL